MADCSCTSVYENSGFPSCLGSLIAAARKIIMVPRYKADGTLNKISLPATLNAAYFTALTNNADRFQRWYPLPALKNVQTPKAESVYETWEDGSKQFVHEGTRTLTGVIPAFNPNYLAVLKSGRCTDMAVYIVDKSGNLVGYTNGEADVLYPLPLNPNTIDAIWEWATDTTGSNIKLSLEFNTDLRDEYISKIDSTSLVAGVNLLGLTGLYDGLVAYTNTGQTTMTFKLNTSYGAVGSLVKVQGLLAADFALFNTTTSLAVVITTAVESTPGTYTLTYASQLVGNVLRLTPTKTGIDFAKVVAAASVVV